MRKQPRQSHITEALVKHKLYGMARLPACRLGVVMKPLFDRRHVSFGFATSLVLDPPLPGVDAMNFNVLRVSQFFDQIASACAFIGADFKNSLRV